jgi:hypothetical protein
MPEGKPTEFDRDVDAVCEALKAAEAGIDRLDFSCTTWQAGRILKGMANHIADLQKLLAKLTGEEAAE